MDAVWEIPDLLQCLGLMAAGPEYLVDPETGCWNWQLYKTKKGYGRKTHSGQPVAAHRLYFERHVGQIPPGYVVHHRCENRACVNPAHLELLEHGRHTRMHWAEKRAVANG